MYPTFDTHAVFRKFINAGISEEHAEAIINAILSSKDTDLSRLATKEQLALLQQEVALLQKDVEYLKENMATKTDLAEVRAEAAETKAELKADIVAVENKVDAVKREVLLAIEKSKNSTLIMVGGATVAICTILGALQYFH